MSSTAPKKIGENHYQIDADSNLGMKVPVRIYANETLLQKMLSDRTIMQARNVASIPGIVSHSVVLPDGHEGYGFPVGGVAAMDAEEGMISPGGVGYDINCGVRLLRSNLNEQTVRSKLKDLVNDLFSSIPSGVGSKGAVRLTNSELDEVLVNGVNWAIEHGYGSSNDSEVCEENGKIANADPNKVSDKARKRGAPQLGSLGSGNHFLEIQKVAEIHDEEAANRMGIKEGTITVLVHCGSRGFGHQVCSDYLRVAEQAMEKYNINLPDRELACVPNNLRSNLNEQTVRSKLKDLVNDLFSSIPSGVGSKGAVRLTNSELDEVLVNGVNWAIEHGYGSSNDSEVCEESGKIANADPNKVSDKARKRGAPQLGSLGSGNHFLEIQKVAEIHDEEAANRMGIKEGTITVLVHCGSRGFGHQVCSDYLRVAEQAMEKYNINLPDRELACVPNNSEEGESYRKAMFAALNFAWSNRQMITHWTRKSFERVFDQTESDLDMKLVYDVAHNIAKVEKHKVDGEERNLVVHRKGATRAFPSNRAEIPSKYRDLGQPVLVPGSMGTSSWILLGKSNSMDLSFGSTAHGAGRTMSRSKARRNFTEDNVKKSLNDKGIFIKALTRDGVVEETPEAYKDVDSVVNVSHNLGIATKVAKLVPIGVIKG